MKKIKITKDTFKDAKFDVKVKVTGIPILNYCVDCDTPVDNYVAQCDTCRRQD